MTAVIDQNFRTGDFREQLGLLLLHGVAAVAPVPRHNDVGVDAVATLLRRASSRRLIAEDSFYVQLKSETVRSIEYSGDQRAWLMGLELPFFIGSVGNGSITLYATHRLSMAAVHGTEAAVISLDLDNRAESVTSELRSYGIGPPVASWNLEEAGDRDEMQKRYQALKSHIVIDRRNIIHRIAGRYENVKWKLNEPAQPNGFGMGSRGNDDSRFSELLAAFYPLLEPLQVALQMKGNVAAVELIRELLENLQQYGSKAGDGAALVSGFLQLIRQHQPSDRPK